MQEQNYCFDTLDRGEFLKIDNATLGRIVLILIIVAFSLLSRAQTLSTFQQDSIISIYYGTIDKATSDSIKSRTFDFDSYDQVLGFKSLFENSGPYFYRKTWSSIAKNIWDAMDKDLPSGNYNYYDILNKDVKNVHKSCVNNVWDKTILNFFVLPEETSDAQFEFDHIITNSLIGKPARIIEYNQLVESYNLDSLGKFYFDFFEGEQRINVLYLWLISNFYNTKIIKKDIKYLHIALDQDLECSNYKMAENYLALAKIYNTLDFYGNFQQTMYALASADAYLDESKNFKKKLSLLSIRADIISNIPGYLSKQEASLLFGFFYERNRNIMTYEERMMTLTLLCKHWGESIELRRFDGIFDHLPINYVSFCLETSKYFWGDEDYFGLLAHSNLVTFNHLEGRRNKSTEYAYDCLVKFPFELDYTSSTRALFSVAADIVKERKYHDIPNFIDSLIKEGYIEEQELIEIKKILNYKEVRKGYKYLRKDLNEIPDDYSNLIYSLTYALRGSQFFESLIYKDMDLLSHVDSTAFFQPTGLDFSLFQPLFDKIYNEPSFNYYANKSFRNFLINRSNAYADERKWRKAYSSLLNAVNSNSNLIAHSNYNLGYTFGWSFSKNEERELKIDRKLLVNTNDSLNNENIKIIQENERIQILNSLLEGETKKYQNILDEKESRLAALNISIKRKTKELQDSVMRLGNVIELNKELAKAKLEADSNSRIANENMELAILTSFITILFLAISIIISLAFWQQRKKARTSERREKLTSFTVHQICHLAPNVINDIKVGLNKGEKTHSTLDILEKFLRSFYDQFNKMKHEKDQKINPSIPLEEEVRMAKYFIALAKNKESSQSDLFAYADRILKFDYDDVSRIAMPPYCFLNVIVNAIKHGAYSTEDAVINVTMESKDKGYWLLNVNNPPKKEKRGSGSGLIFINETLKEWNEDQKNDYLSDGYTSKNNYQTKLSFKNKKEQYV